MPRYEFKNKKGKIIEKSFSMKDDIPKVITIGKSKYCRVFSLPNIGIDTTKAKTLGAQARKNTEQGIKEGRIKPKVKPPNPWWRPNKDRPDMSLAKLTKTQKERYIRTGKK